MLILWQAIKNPVATAPGSDKTEPTGWRTGGFLVRVCVLEEHYDARNHDVVYGFAGLVVATPLPPAFVQLAP